ncbi:unnamed protein product [Urochloa decumbens]|uniref:AAA+ ATPase domain-containing protein n=1 Tax=Urochloa decumbens TaxID=240449 RepID=A0ABC8YDX5_9POAL
MATALVGAAFSVVGKALAPFTDDLLKDWAASVKLGDNVRALELELLSAKALLQPVLHKEIDNSALMELLVMLQDLGYDAEDVLDELDYFRIQDQLHGTFEAVDRHDKGCACNLMLNAKAVGKHIVCLPACLSGAKGNRRGLNKGGKAKPNSRSCCNPVHAVGKCFPCSSLPSVDDDDNSMPNSPERSHTNEPKKLKFNRVDASKRMQHIIEQLRLVHQRVSGIITALGLNWSTVPNIAQSRPITTSESTEPRLYGRDHIMNGIIRDITGDKHCGEVLTVIPIVGPGGIGKTTLAQHIYHNEKVQQHFDVKIWICVSFNFNANKLIQEIEKCIPEVDGESKGTAAQLIEQRLKKKRFLLVLDDIWDCSNEYEWEQLLLPFRKSQVKANIIIATTRSPAQAQIMVRKTDHSVYLQGLDHKEFKDLFLDFVFGDDQSRKDHTFLLETGDKIIGRLKGSPLAAKTVGRLLRNQLDLVHWTRVLESKEWEHSDDRNDIMPALKLSYDYLPSQLQLCFSYCALFPQDYKFEREELINFWIGLDVLHLSHGENKRVEDIGLSHLTQLINHGFLEKRAKQDGPACYIVHDLLHELARKVSSHECLIIDSSQSQVSSLQIRPSIRHLSINIDGTSVQDRLTLKNCVEDFNTLDKRLKVEKLRSLMLFGEHHGCFVNAFGDLFREAKALRVVFLSQASYEVENLLHNFYYLVHLRYLRIESSSRDKFPNKLSRFYHMMVLDARNYDNIMDLPRDMSNLIKLRHFLVCEEETHESIFEVGKLRSLQELRRFSVKQEDQGFELRQLGQLVQLCGSLCIDNLENVQIKEEADEAKLIQKSRLHELRLCWNTIQSSNETALEEQVLERLKPSSNLLKLSITGHRGATCPSWLGINLSVRSLEYLRLSYVAWQTFPPIGELSLVNVPPEEISCKTPGKRFENLRRLELVNLASLKKWAVHDPCQLFPYLEALVIRDCSNLVELLFPHSTCCQQDNQALSFPPRLLELNIGNCPQLLSFPPVPWTESEAPCSIKIEGTGIPGLCKLVCAKKLNSEYFLEIVEKDIPDNTFWNVLALNNLSTLTRLNMLRCQPLPLCHLQMLSSLRTLEMSCPSNVFPFDEVDNHVQYQFPVELLRIHHWSASGKDLTQLLTYFPELSDLQLWDCEKITGLGVSVMGHQATATPGPSSSGHKVNQQQDARAEEEIVSLVAEGLLLLPPHVQELWICEYPEMSLRSNPLSDNKEDGRTGGGGLQGLSSLRKLSIWTCPKFLSSYYSSSFLLPSSLEYLELEGVVGFETVVPLSNLSALTELSIRECGDLRVKGLWSLLAQGHLTKLQVTETPKFFVDPKPSCVDEQVLPSRSSKLEELIMDDVAGVTATPICSLIFSSLTTLAIYRDAKVEHLTEEQEALLFINSLEVIRFEFCDSLKYLPARLHALPRLKRLSIWKCKAVRMLPENGLPSSLEELVIDRCPEIQSLRKNCLPSSLQKLVIGGCPGIRSLPKVNDLPSSLRELCILFDNSKELTRHCRRLTGIIPIVKIRD